MSLQAESKFSLIHLLALFWLSADWMMAAHIGKGNLLYTQSTDASANLFQRKPHTARNNVLPAI